MNKILTISLLFMLPIMLNAADHWVIDIPQATNHLPGTRPTTLNAPDWIIDIPQATSPSANTRHIHRSRPSLVPLPSANTRHIHRSRPSLVPLPSANAPHIHRSRPLRSEEPQAAAWRNNAASLLIGVPMMIYGPEWIRVPMLIANAREIYQLISYIRCEHRTEYGRRPRYAEDLSNQITRALAEDASNLIYLEQPMAETNSHRIYIEQPVAKDSSDWITVKQPGGETDVYLEETAEKLVKDLKENPPMATPFFPSPDNHRAFVMRPDRSILYLN